MTVVQVVDPQDATRPPKQVAPAFEENHDATENSERCCADEYAPSGFDHDESGHPSATPVSQRKPNREVETLPPRKRYREEESLIQGESACYEKPEGEKKDVAKKNLKPMEKPPSADAHRMLRRRRWVRKAAIARGRRKAVEVRGRRKAVEVEKCGETSKSSFPASRAVGANGGIAIRDERVTTLEPKHKVFLSHSGAQKDFVEQLCVDLERCDRYPFFDRRRSSLPIGENFSKLIFEGIEQCEVGVVVFSKEFFTRSKWPMLELVAMTKNPKLVIIPVYLNISLKKVHDVKKREMWLSVWQGWAKEDERLNIEEWCGVFKRLRSLNSLVYNGGGEVGFREEIVGVVCKLVLPETRWRDSHIQGKMRLCKVLHDKIEQARSSNGHGPCLVGVYGMGGIGKTTICQALCNDYSTRMHGKVCHLELGSASNLELVHEALRRFSDKSYEVWSRWNESQCLDLLRREMQKHKVFLAIDNLCDGQKSLEQASLFLDGCFGGGSIVIVTSRSLKVLRMHCLGINEKNCLEMPELEFDDAKSLFLQHAKCDQKTLREVGDNVVEGFIKRCHFKKSDGESYHYHPLALKILGMHLRGMKYNGGNWEAELKVLDAFNPRRELEHPIFSILRRSFDALLQEDKMVFVDVALYKPESSRRYKCNVLKWLSMVHGRHVQEVTEVLKGLERKALIEDLGDGGFTKIGMHDLWHEFAALETRVGEFGSRYWLYEVNASSALDATTPMGGLWQHMRRMCFSNNGLSHLKSIKLNHFSNIVVMKLVPDVDLNYNLVLDVSKLVHLKSLELDMLWCFRGDIKVVGLRLLKSLLFLRFINVSLYPRDSIYSDNLADDIEQLTSLRVLVLDGFLTLDPPNLSNLIFLEEVNIKHCLNVGTIHGLSSRLCNLRVLILDGCRRLQSLGPSAWSLQALQELSLHDCVNLKEESTLFLLMLRNPVFKQQYAEKLMVNCQALIESVVHKNIIDTPYAVVEHIDAHECAFCRSEFGDSDKSKGWIAFVNRYNIPKLVMNKREEVDKKDSAESIVKAASMANGTKDAKQLVVYLGEDMINNTRTVHVRCCGHQVHEECFRSYQSFSEALYTVYRGANTGFLCPICRQSANALLPVVHQASLSRTLQASKKSDLKDQRKHWEKFWEKRKSLFSSMDLFATKFPEQAKELLGVPVLWGVFASNIMHREAASREKLQKVSTTSHQSSNQRMWGRDTGHLIAIQELAKLAMVSTTLVTGTEMATKMDKMKSIAAGISKFLQNRELKNEYLRNVFTSVHDTLRRLQKSVEESCEPDVVANNKGKEEETYQRHGEVKASSPKPSPSPYQPSFSSFSCEPQEQVWKSSEPPQPELFQGRAMRDSMRAGSLHGPVMGSLGSSSLPDCSLFSTDPFRLLIVLLSSFPGWPKVDKIFLLVKFSYMVALTQALIACSKMQKSVDLDVTNLERDWGEVIRYALLRFLRRAALLVQSITGESCKLPCTGSGRKVMDSWYLHQKLGLEDAYRSLMLPSGADNVEHSSLNSLLQLLQSDKMNAAVTLMKVPISLPWYYQCGDGGGCAANFDYDMHIIHRYRISYRSM